MTKNLVAFVLFAVALLFGWSYLQRQLWPVDPNARKATKADKAGAKDEQPVAKADLPPKVDGAPKAEVPPKVDGEKTPNAKGVAKDPLAKDPPAKPAPVEEPIPAPKEASVFTMGDETSFLTLDLTNRGAGVQSLTLTRFEAANYLGLPADRPLKLIQDDPFVPSFQMYHYPDAAASAPKAGLGEALWNVEGDGVVKEGDGWKIAFWTLVPEKRQLKIVKTYRLKPNEYHVSLGIEIQNTDKNAGKTEFRYQLMGAHGLPIEGEWYTPPGMLRTAVIGVLDHRDNLIRTIEDSGRISGKKMGELVPVGNSWLQYAGVMTQYFTSLVAVDPRQPFGDWQKEKSLISSARPVQMTNEIKAVIVGIGASTITFRDAKGEMVTAKMLPRAREHFDTLGLKVGSNCVVNVGRDLQTGEQIVGWFRLGTTPLGYFDDITVSLNSDTLVLPPGEKVGHNFLLYHGPVKTRLLRQIGRGDEVLTDLADFYTYKLHLDTLTDYPSDSIFGTISSKIGWTFLLIQTTKLMHFLLFYLHFLSFGNWGLSIILLTVVVRGAMFPISRKQAIMSQKMQALAPEIKKLQEKFKDDKPAQAQATMELYRKHKVSPAGGCLPLLLQMPIFMGLYFCLQESVQFRLAKFLWIENLAAPDMLLWWGQTIPWFTDPNSLGGMLYLGPFFNLLPVIAVAFMIVQQKLMAPPPQTEEQQVQQKTMQVMMGVMGLFFYKVAAGLCLYFIASSVWGVAERKMLPKLAPVDTTPTPDKPNQTARDRRRERDRGREKPEPTTNMEKLKDWWQRLLESAEKK